MFVPLESLRVTSIAEAVGPAIMWYLERGTTLLITGGENSHLIFLDGEYAGRGFPNAGNTSWEGLAAEDVVVEVDLDAVHSANKVDAPPRSIRLDETGMHVVAAVEDQQGWTNVKHIPLGQPRDGNGSGRVYFTKWRARVRSGKELVTVLEVDTSS